VYIENKYTRWYMGIINNARQRTTYDTSIHERHHIIPKSLGGSDYDDNLVIVTFREHFLLHLLLPKMIGEPVAVTKMQYALFCMSNGFGRTRVYNSVLYSAIKEKFSGLRSERMQGANNHFYGRRHSETAKMDMSINNPARRPEVRAKISRANKGHTRSHGRVLPQESREKISKSLTGNKHKEESIIKMREQRKNNVWVKSIDGIECKFIPSNHADELIQTGQWIRGRKTFERNFTEGSRNRNKLGRFMASPP
jgi:hypothetical protein